MIERLKSGPRPAEQRIALPFHSARYAAMKRQRERDRLRVKRADDDYIEAERVKNAKRMRQQRAQSKRLSGIEQNTSTSPHAG